MPTTVQINKTWQLPPSTGYFQDVITKKQVVLHHTVGGTARSTFNYWVNQANHVATAYIADRDGTLYEVFDPKFWAWHLGLKLAQNTIANKQSIGIEIASAGPLRSGKELNTKLGQNKFDVNYLYAFDIDVVPFTNAKKYYNMTTDAAKFVGVPTPFRGYSFFDAYTELQTASTISLVNYLCEQFHIPRQLIPNQNKLEFDISTLNFSGIITHCNVRQDKSDLDPYWSWDRLQKSFG
jgi:N-acetyl-anhydromuramyl-L-alanine amidase AmpD